MLASIQPVDPLHLHRHWPFLKQGLDAVIAKAKNTRWWIEDVYAAVQCKAATAYIVSTNRPVGFFIVHPQSVLFTGETELFLWILWSLPLREWNGPDRLQVVHETLQFIAALALQQGHSAVATLTVRRGLMRRYAHLWKCEVFPARMPLEALQQLVAT